MSIFKATIQPIKEQILEYKYHNLETVNTFFIKSHDIPQIWYLDSERKPIIHYIGQTYLEDDKFLTWKCKFSHQICSCSNAIWIRSSIKRENEMAVITPEAYRAAFNDKKAEINTLTDEELDQRISELEQLIRELNMEARAAIVERSERSTVKREKIRLVDASYKIKNPEPERKEPSKPKMSKEDRLKEAQIKQWADLYMKKDPNMTEFDARSKAQEKVEKLWEE